MLKVRLKNRAEARDGGDGVLIKLGRVKGRARLGKRQLFSFRQGKPQHPGDSHLEVSSK